VGGFRAVDFLRTVVSLRVKDDPARGIIPICFFGLSKRRWRSKDALRKYKELSGKESPFVLCDNTRQTVENTERVKRSNHAASVLGITIEQKISYGYFSSGELPATIRRPRDAAFSIYR
jgi:hypothetical protein